MSCQPFSILSRHCNNTAVRLSARICARLPANCQRCTDTRPCREQALYTRPTGFRGLPPPGPAIPVTDAPISAGIRFSSPRTIASAHSDDTAPGPSIICPGTSRSPVFIPLEYVTSEPRKTSLLPACAVRSDAIPPPVHDSAVARVMARDLANSRACPASQQLIVIQLGLVQL
jgi:hypothetical protein